MSEESGNNSGKPRWSRKKESQKEHSEAVIAVPTTRDPPRGKCAKLFEVEGEPTSSENVLPPPAVVDDTRVRRGKGRGNATQINSTTGFGKGGRGLSHLTSEPFNAGIRTAYLQRYNADLERLCSRSDLPATARWIDSHCHLESILHRTWRGGGKPQVLENEPFVGLEELVASWPSQLDGCINVCCFRQPSNPKHPISPKSTEWRWMEENLRHFESDSPYASKLWFTIGIHPHSSKDWDDSVADGIRHFAAHSKCVAVGECGVDFFKHDLHEKELQLRSFRAQAALAVELKKALVIHARLVTEENENMFLQEMEQALPTDHWIHVHCYSDSLTHALDLCARWPNLRIGFTGSITFRDRGRGKGKKGEGSKGKKGAPIEKKGEEHCRELVQGIPLERLLIETDGPYMCPEPFRGQTAHPGHVHRIAERIAEWKNVPLGTVMKATRESTFVVYGI